MTQPDGDDEPQQASTAVRRQNLHHGAPSPKRPRGGRSSRSPTPKQQREGYFVADVVELRETTSCLAEDTLSLACNKLCQSGRTAVVVLSKSNEVQGALTENDILQAIVKGEAWDQSLQRWLQDGLARLPSFLVPPMTVPATTSLVEAAKLMSEQQGGQFSCHHLLVQVAEGKNDDCGRPLKARLLSALDIANGMIEAAKSSVAAEKALALSVQHVMKPRTSVPSCDSGQSLAEAFRVLSSSHQNCVLVEEKEEKEPPQDGDEETTDRIRGVVTPADALLAFSEKISGDKRILGDWVRGTNDTPSVPERFVEASTSLAAAASTMAFTGQHHLLVVQAPTSHVVGVVSALDMVRALSRLFHVSEAP